MVNYEGKGIEPDILIRNTFAQAKKRKDAVIYRTIEILDKNTQ